MRAVRVRDTSFLAQPPRLFLVRAHRLRLSFRDGPRQNRLHGGQPWIVGFPDYRQQLKPLIVGGVFKEFANRTRHKIRHGHSSRRCATLDLPRHVKRQCPHDAICDIRAIKLRDQLSKHNAPIFLRNVRNS